MKIISNIKDYYDGAAAQFGYSDDVVYRRLNSMTVVDGFGMSKHNKLIGISPRVVALNNCSFTLGFCGKLYYGLMYDNSIYGKPLVYYPYLQSDVAKVISNYEEFCKNRRYKWESTGEFEQDFLISCGHLKAEMWGRTRSKGMLDIVENHEIFQDFGCPSFAIVNKYVTKLFTTDYTNNQFVGTEFKARDWQFHTASYRSCDERTWIIKNPILKDFDFGKLVDPYTAVQELEMYIGRLATNETPQMPVGSDKVIAESKGYDKWSFRTMPTKKKLDP